MYGAIILAWSRRYKVKASLDHLPIVLTTSKGTPRRRYSRVPPIRSPWPLRSGRPAADAARDTLFVNSDLDKGRRPFSCFHANKWSSGLAVLMRMWLAIADLGSVGPSWAAQYAPSPASGEDFVLGRMKLVTGRPLRSVDSTIPALDMCFFGSKPLTVLTVNSPNLAMQ